MMPINVTHQQYSNQWRGGRGGRVSRGGRGRGRGGRGGAQGPQCYNCGQFGHKRDSCTKPKTQPKPSANSPYCDYHKSHTHSTEDCRQKKLADDSKQSADEKFNQTVLVDMFPAETRPATEKDGAFYLDSGAQIHICNDRKAFTNLNAGAPIKISGFQKDGRSDQCKMFGTVELRVPVDGNVNKLVLDKVAYVPNARRNLVSLACLGRGITHKGVVPNKQSQATWRFYKHEGQPLFDVEYVAQTWRVKTCVDDEPVLLPGEKKSPLGIMRASGVSSGDSSSVSVSDVGQVAVEEVNVETWHDRLGHPSKAVLAQALKKAGMQPQGKLPEVCAACMAGKATKQPFPHHARHRASEPLGRVHSDLCGPFAPSLGGARYMAIFVDDHSRWKDVKFIHSKSQLFGEFKAYVQFWQAQKGHRVLIWRTDNGGEFTSEECKRYCLENGIVREFSTPNTPQQNGVSERNERTVEEHGLCMLSHAGLPQPFWAEAFAYAAFISNNLPCSANPGGAAPVELWAGKPPELELMRVFGCAAYWRTGDPGKLDVHAKMGIFVGVDPQRKAWRVYNLESHKVFSTRDVVFNEHYLPFKHMQATAQQMAPQMLALPPVQPQVHVPVQVAPSGSAPQVQPAVAAAQHVPAAMVVPVGPVVREPAPAVVLPVPDKPAVVAQRPQQEVVAVAPKPLGARVKPVERAGAEKSEERSGVGEKKEEEKKEGQAEKKSKRTQSQADAAPAPVRVSTRNAKGTNSWYQKDTYITEACTSEASEEPQTYQEAINGPDAPTWRRAMQEEYDKLIKNKTWQLVERPSGAMCVSTKWVFARKKDERGVVVENKARLVARGFTQIHGEHFNNTYAGVARRESWLLIKALAAQHSLKLHQLDVKSAFLNGDIDCMVHMDQPEGFDDGSGRVCLLQKGLYGLRQSAMLWSKDLTSTLRSIGFKQCQADSCIYVLRDGEQLALLSVWVDDIEIAHNSDTLCKHIVSQLTSKYEIKDKGPSRWLLNMEIGQDHANHTVTVSQQAYIKQILKDFNMESCNPTAAPAAPGELLTQENCPKTDGEREEMKDKPFAQLVGALNYLATCTRPDIAYAIHKLCSFIKNPGQAHWAAAKRIVRYLQGSKTQGIKYKQVVGGNRLVVYTDASWGDNANGTSTSGYVVNFAGGPVAWSSSSQRTVSRSTCEAEYVGMSTAAELLKRADAALYAAKREGKNTFREAGAAVA